MKKIFLTTFLALFSLISLEAKSADYMSKIVKLYNLKTNGAIEFNITKTEDGYNLYPLVLNSVYQKIFSKKPMHIVVDEGPIVTSPHFTLATAGLSSKGNVLDFFNPEIVKDINSTLKKIPKYSYEAVVSFGNELEEKSTIDAVDIESNEVKVNTSKIVATNKFDLDSFTGVSTLKLDKAVLKPKKEKGIIELKDIDLTTKVTQEPIDNLILFADTSFKVSSVKFNTTKGDVAVNFSAKIDGTIKRVDTNLLDFGISEDTKALDAKTIALAKGIKESSLDLKLKNLGISGVVEFLKLSRELENLNNKLMQATRSNDSAAMQKAILEQQEKLNSVVSIYNKTFIGNKSRLVLDLNLLSDKKSFVKLDLLYKGKPISGNVQSAIISLASQPLALFDGDFEVQLDSSLATTVNPFAIMGLDLLKAKGFATAKDGIYHLKGSLKDGKIILNGKAYTIKELTQALFKI